MNSKIYRQADSRWGKLPYPTKNYTFAHNGCGCCSVTHCAIENPKYANYTPADVRKYMVQFATKGHGTLWDGITKGLQYYGYNVHWNKNDNMATIFSVLAKSLKRGVILFGSTKGPDKTVWTTGGHYIAFVDYKIEGGKHWFYLKDSGGRHHDKWWCYEKSMKGDVRNVWICTSWKEAPAPTPSKPAKGTYTGTIPAPTIKNGTKGDKVANLQKFLNWYGGYGLKVDKICGKATVAALKKFQSAEGLKADGIYGKATQGKANAYKKVSPQPVTNKCIDVSYWQGKISQANWEKVKKTCGYAICRASYTSQKSFTLNPDSTFATNFVNAKAAGLKVGAYHYSQAITVAEAKQEAEYLCNILKNFTPTFYVVCDFEFGGRLNKKIGTKASDIANAFCDVVKARGYSPCIYANTSTLNGYLKSPKYPVWVAQYNSTCTYTGSKVMWQYTSSGKVDGITGKVDLSHVYEVSPQQVMTAADKAVSWAKATANSGKYSYKKWVNDDKNTKLCPICHSLAKKYQGWNCIGFVSAAYFHGAGNKNITCSCSGMGTDSFFTKVTEASWQKRNGSGWKMITNGGSKGGSSIPVSNLKVGDVLIGFDKDGVFHHIALYSGNGNILESTKTRTPNVGERTYKDLCSRHHITRAFRYT